MSTAKLNVWVTAIGDASRVDMSHKWFVHVLHPSGDVLQWAGTDYRNLETTDGHREIELPPGEYMVVATWSLAPGGTAPSTLGNHATHVGVVRVNSCDHVGVILFAPTFHFCLVWWIIALQGLQALKVLPKDAVGPARTALEAAENLLRYIPADEFTRKMVKIEEKKRKR